MPQLSAAQAVRGRPSAQPVLEVTQAELEQIGQSAGRHGVRTMRDGANVQFATRDEAEDAIALDPSLEGHELVTVTDPETGERAVVAITSGEPMEPPPEVRQRRGVEPAPEDEEGEARMIRPVDRDGPRAVKPAQMQSGTRVQLTDDDMRELKDISYDFDRTLGRKLGNVRDPNFGERAIARAHRPFWVRESERRERMVVVEEPGKNPLIVSLAEKPTAVPNAISVGMHAASALPLTGLFAYAPAGGLLQTVAGLGAIGAGLFTKNENSLQLIRTGVKHALWGVVNTVLDLAGFWPARLLLTGAGVAMDVAQAVASRKQRPVQVIEVEKPATLWQKVRASVDWMAGGIAKLFKR